MNEIARRCNFLWFHGLLEQRQTPGSTEEKRLMRKETCLQQEGYSCYL